MKLQGRLAVGQPMHPAFDLLRASLRAAQAATPTAIASGQLDRLHRQVMALQGLLGELAAEDEQQSWAGGSFYCLNMLPDEAAL